MLTIESLKAWGANTDEGLERCFGNGDFLLKLVRTVPGEANFAKLRESIAAGNLEAGFEAAHSLKGVLGNLSLTPLYDPIADITEHLRAREAMDYAPALEVIEQKLAELTELCAD